MEAALDIPSYFLCPISLEIMRDPVTVSTGITYDRESIQRWLSSGKRQVCPVTKQPLLLDVELTPNHTLRRIIQAWCTLNASDGVDRIPTPTSQLDKTQIVKLIDQARKLPHTQLQCLKRLRSMAAIQGERNKNYSLEAAGAVEYAASLISNPDQSVMEVAVEVLFHLRSSESRLKDIMSKDGEKTIDSLVQVLKRGDYQSRSQATILLRSVFELADPNRLMSATVDLFIEIMNVVRDQISQQAFKAAVKLLVELCPWGRNRIKAVESGTVSVLIEALLETQEKRACELILISLDQLCACAEGRAELLRHAAGIVIVSKKILRVSHLASDRAVRILFSISRFSATSAIVKEMLQVGVVAKLCLVLQVDCMYKTKEKARDILKLHSRVWKSSSCVPAHLLSFYPSTSSSS